MVLLYMDIDGTPSSNNAVVASSMQEHIINTSYQKLPFGSGDDPENELSS